jgi:hypothetical protein
MKEQDEKEEGKKRKRSTSETEDTREKKSMKIEELTEMDKILQSYGLPISFDSTKEKHVEGSDCYGVKIERTRKWRQYMHKGKRKTEEEENK